ncbi:unnamed protein product [Lactuca saligna]|uniref:Alpha/beta hydrolase fold-3 domain-containing protein n=1 Tax=Lactuca saligna TaxID=75948 RepID=A0AA36EEP7_LACSI|nr:unnamed protein product [Lactuca saligna]
MVATTKPPQPSLSLPWKTRIHISLFSAVTEACSRKNGTVNRGLLKYLLDFRTPPTSKSVNGVASHDVVVDETRNLWFRVYVPTQHAGEDLPVIVFFHGGGFAFLSPDVEMYDVVCRRFARKVPAIVVSVNYRLSPEHRYPAQHDDCFDVLTFLDDEENRSKCLPENANMLRCFIAGDSAGGNLAHHVAQRACEFNFRRLKVIGVVAIQPFFGGEERTDSETRLDGTPIVSKRRTDWFWKVFLPKGEGFNRDHPISNVSGPNAVDISKVDFPATMVVVAGFDPLYDWQKRYYKWLKESGKEVCLFEYPNMCHAFYLFPELAESEHLFGQVKDFIEKVSSNVATL